MKLSTCHYCNRIFTRARNTKQFCSLECKNKYNYTKRNNEETPVEIFNQLTGKESLEPANDSRINEYLKRIEFLENELETKKKEITKPTKDNITPTPQIEVQETSPKKSNSNIPFLAKKERIIEQLLGEDMEVVSKEELEMLGYPLGFFDGWSDDGEQLERYNIKITSSGDYQISAI